MHREEIFIRINEIVNRHFDNDDYTNCIKTLDVALPHVSERKYGKQNQGHCTVIFTQKIYATYFKSIKRVVFHPTEYQDRVTKEIMQSRAISSLVDIRKHDNKPRRLTKPKPPIVSFSIRSHEQPTPRQPTPTIANGLEESLSLLAVSQPDSMSQPAAFSNNISSDCDEQPNDDSAAQQGESYGKILNDAALQLTREQERRQKGSQESSQEGSQEGSKTGSQECSLKGSADADLGPTLRQMQADLFKPDFYE